MAGNVVEQSGLVLERGGLVVDGCGGCPLMPFAFTFLGTGGSPFVTGNLTWSATAVGGVDPGWRYATDVEVCPTSLGSQLLSLREIVLWCDGTTWKLALVVLFGTIQDSYSTVGGSLDPMTLNNPSGPRTYYTQTPGDVSACDDTGKLRVDVQVQP